MRQLKHHEQKLLKKVDFLSWKGDQTREAAIMRRYHIQNREDYASYNRLCGSLRQLAHKLQQLSPEDAFRVKMEGSLLSKLYDMGVLDVSTTSLDQLDDKITVSAFCRRRLAVVLCKLKMCQTVKMAVQFIEQGHVRVGPDTMTDPAFLVTRNMEDFVTWVDSSKLKRTVASYNDELDDFDLMTS